MKTPLRSTLGFVFLAILVISCKTSSVSEYLSPRVQGRVLDSQSGLPIKNVKVIRFRTAENGVEDYSKGAAQLKQPPEVRTSADGTFNLPSERDFAVLFSRGWYSVTITFRHPSYETLTKTYTLSDSTNTPAGEPLILARDILLNPLRLKTSPSETQDAFR